MICALAWGCSAGLCFAADSRPAKNVLILYSFSKRDFFGSQTLESTIRSNLSEPVNFYVEYLEAQRFGNRDYKKSVSDTLRETYAKQKLDLVIVAVYPALQFAVEFRDRIFPGVPIVFMMVVPDRLPSPKLWPGVTGVTMRGDVRGTLDLALRLHPETKNVAVVGGTSEFESYWVNATHQELRLRAKQMNEIDLVGLTPDQLLHQAFTLPPHTVVIFELVPQESLQLAIGTYDVLAAISQQFPTYCIHDYCFDHGAIGGSYPDFDEQVLNAGQLAARVLSGESPESIPVIHATHVLPEVDWRQLRRWNIPESALPSGTKVLYRQLTVWQQYRKYVLAGVLVIVVQTMLIIGLLWQRERKRRAEARLSESEKRFRALAETTPSLLWICGKDGKVTYLSDRRINFTGRDPEAGFADAWTAFIHPDDIQNVLTANFRALEQQQGFSKEYRLRRRDGVYRWMLDVAAPRFDGNGLFAGFIGSATDVTDQKLAQEALEKMSGRLIEAQEKERSRIARELHDDICQRLALLSLELEMLTRGVKGVAKAGFEEVQQRCSEIAGDVQALSHQLHSSKLDYLGLEAALRTCCEEFSDKHNVTVELTAENVPDHLPGDISLCLFRVAQEALQNAVKYSGVHQFSVDLRTAAHQIRLEVSDAGVGFNVETAMQNGGLGLVSMPERVHLVKGRFSVESKVNSGTKVVATIPLVAEMDAAETLSATV
ncbi:MAG: PAS domain S-box protein [Candidatus Korobacteraceae bacterium]|jgi:PAS domain S-box-containing protein